MRKVLILLIAAIIVSCSPTTLSKHAPADPLRSNKTYSYHEGISWWDSLASYSKYLKLDTFGNTDANYPLHIATLSIGGVDLSSISSTKKTIILINNAIHPGEPDGVDASMALYRNLCMGDSLQAKLENCILVCIPFYNIGGSLNRNTASRANQNGPEEYGFRGNAQNLDLNRDFVKADSRNAQSFARLLQLIDPDIYIETHVSNGADYQYTMTYLSTQIDKLSFGMGKFLETEMIPSLEHAMTQKNQQMVPYVNVHGTALGNAYEAFYDSPRYSTGLTTLHQIFGFITETHMLKPYDERVQATYDFLESMLQFANKNSIAIQDARNKAKAQVAKASSFVLDWEIDSSRSKNFTFKGYEHSYIPSDISNHQRLFYDRTKPIDIEMKFYAYFKPKTSRDKPIAYVIPQGYHQVVKRLKQNGVKLEAMKFDAKIEVVRYKITSFETANNPFEKHYYHYNTSFQRDTILKQFIKGDYIIKMGTDKDRLLVELLEPDAPDSYFNWNFFDAVLQQKEWYSPYVFESEAAELLQSDSALRNEFNNMMATTPGFKDNSQWQLYWLYQHSKHYEAEHMSLPIYRLEFL